MSSFHSASNPGMFLSILMCWTLCSVGSYGQCMKGKSAKRVGLTFPDLASKSFKAKLSGVFLSNMSAMHVKEHYSVESSRGSVHYDQPYDVDYFFLTDENGVRAVSHGKRCTKTEADSLMGIMAHLTKSSLNPDIVTFIENTRLAGIPVNRWRSCYPFKLGGNAEKLVASLDVYLSSDEQWEMYSEDIGGAILRLAVKVFIGRELQENYYLDFLEFENLDYDANKFQADLEPPLGSVCTGLQKDQEQPPVPRSVSFWQETVKETQADRIPTNEEYVILDTANQVFEIQLSNMTLIEDFKGGAGYMTSQNGNLASTCSIFSLKEAEKSVNVDISTGFTEKDHYVSIDSVQNYFHLSGNFTFSGEYDVRGIPCNAFTHVSNNYLAENTRASIVQYFSRPGIVVADTVGISENKLVKLQVQVKDKERLNFNIFDYDELDFRKDLQEPYDTSQCYSEKQQIKFLLVFEDHDSKEIMTAHHRRTLEHWMREFIAEVCKIDLVRVQVGRSVQGQGTVSLPGLLLDKANSLAHFDIYKSKSFGNVPAASARVLSVKSYVNSLGECAAYSEADVDSSDADYCQDSELCIVYRKADAGEQDIALTQDTSCSHLTKVKGYSLQRNLMEAWYVLETHFRNITLQLKVIDKILKASFIEKTNDPSAVLYGNNALSNFRKTAHLKLKSVERRTIQATMDSVECAEQCLNNLVFPCEAFSYCTDSMRCEILGIFPRGTSPQNNFSSTIDQKDCQVYSRSYLHNFEQHFKSMDSLATPGSDSEYTDVKHSEDCAKLCMENNEFQCESFDFCSQNGVGGSCILRKHHWRDTPHIEQGRLEQNCSHFSRNYIWDYTRRNGVTSLPVRNTVMKAGGAQTCAYECSASHECLAFHYCELGDVCQFIHRESGEPALDDVVPMFRCYTFTRTQSLNLTSRHSQLRKRLGKEEPSEEGYSDGAMAGLALSMLVVGVVLSFLGTLAWSWYRGRRNHAGDTMEDAFTMDDPQADNDRL